MQQGLTLTDLRRERYVKVNDEYKAYSGGKKYAEESKIRIEVPIQAGVGQYTIDIKKQNITNKREISLDRNDIFVPNFVGCFLALQSTTKPSTEILMPYPAIADGTNPSVHAVGFTNKEIFALYNGRLTWLVDNGVAFQAYPTERFLKVPQTQGAFVLDSTDAAVNEQIQSEWSVLDACDVMIPKFTIAGTRDHQVTINFDAAGLTFPVTEGYTPVLVFYMDGLLVKGGCEFYDQKNPNGPAVGQW